MKKQIVRCDHCNSIISERRIELYTGLVYALWRVYIWCLENNVDTFQRKQIKKLFKNENDTARFGDWIYFGDLVYKPTKGLYRINFEACERFFSGNSRIPIIVWKNPVTKKLLKEKRKYIYEVRGLETLLNRYGEFVPEYR